MTLNLFHQFSSPICLGIPLTLIALLMPWLIFPTPDNRFILNRTATLQAWLVKSFTKQIFSPLSISGQKWALMLVSLMLFIFTTNLLGLLPYTFTTTTQLSMNLGLAVPLWLATVMIGFRNRFSASLSHLLPEGTPTLLVPMLAIIETISLIIRPIALGVRLTANLTAGHLLIQLVSTATISLFSTPLLSAITFLTLLLLFSLEIAVAIIQAYVFVLLLSLYLQENT